MKQSSSNFPVTAAVLLWLAHTGAWPALCSAADTGAGTAGGDAGGRTALLDGNPIAATPLAHFRTSAACLIRGSFIMTDVLGRWRLIAEDGTHVLASPASPASDECPETLPPGTVVRLLGRPQPFGGLLQMHQARLRPEGRVIPLPGPVETTTAGSNAPGMSARRITVSGRLWSFEKRQMANARPPFAKSDYHVGVLGNDEDATRIAIICSAEMEVKLQALKGDHLVKVTGFQMPASLSGTDAPQIWPRTLDDIQDAGLAPAAIRRNLWWGGSGLAALLLAAFAFIIAQREKLRRQRSEALALGLREQNMRELNATLELRVAERTAETEKARADLAAALQEEREVGELKSRFVSTVSHEFRTPLGVIMSATDILESYMDRITPERKMEHLAEIRSATRHMSGMMEDVLLLGRAESGRLHVTRRPADLLDLCQRIANEAHSATSQTGSTVVTCDSLPGDAFVDEMLLRHMLSNLLSNAIKYSGPGAEVGLHIGCEGPDAVISVTDRGIGIPAEDASKLFQPFARAGNVGARSGTGLGLVVVKRCAELHGGTVGFTSTPGEGSTFTLRIPVWNSGN